MGSANELTGAQRIAESEAELGTAVREELTACVDWWRVHPEELSDNAAPDRLVELEELAGALESGPVPSYAHEEVKPRRLLADGPHTSITVHPVSAVTFAGLTEATNQYLTGLAQVPRDGLGQALRASGRELAGELGLLSDR